MVASSGSPALLAGRSHGGGGYGAPVFVTIMVIYLVRIGSLSWSFVDCTQVWASIVAVTVASIVPTGVLWDSESLFRFTALFPPPTLASWFRARFSLSRLAFSRWRLIMGFAELVIPGVFVVRVGVHVPHPFRGFVVVLASCWHLFMPLARHIAGFLLAILVHLLRNSWAVHVRTPWTSLEGRVMTLGLPLPLIWV